MTTFFDQFFAIAAVATCLIIGSRHQAYAFPPRPHILVLLADDLGWNDVSFHGSDQIPTPNIDAMAYNGIILNHHYVQPVCTPSRAALMTGRYPIHTGMQGSPIRPPDPDGVPLQFRLLPEYLRELGYRTHAVGKWHLGYYRRPYLPQQRGFETYFGVYNGYSGYYDYMAQNMFDNKVYTGFDLHRNETPAWDLVGRYATDIFSNEAVRLIKSHNPQEPMFLYMAYTAVHATNQGRYLEAPQARINSFKYIIEPNRRVYAAMVSKLDDSIGEIVEALKDNQMLDNTIILFMSDNGAPAERQAIYPNWGSNFPFRGAKETLWEGGTRSPTFIWSKEFQANPRVSNELFHITDWLPTLVSAAGGDRFRLPSDLDGHDQWYSLRWNLPSARKEALLNINEKERTAGIVTRYDTINPNRRTWKLVVGTASEGKFDGVYNDVRSPLNPLYDFKKVLNCPAYRSLTALYGAPVKETQMRFLRQAATIQCNDNSIVDDVSRAPNCNAHPCLFNLDVDPCEKFDLAPNNTGIVQQLYGQLKFFRRTLVPQQSRVPDYPAADPRRFNNTWATWVY